MFRGVSDAPLPPNSARHPWHSFDRWAALVALTSSVFLTVAGARQWWPFPHADPGLDEARRVTWSFVDGASLTIDIVNNADDPIHGVTCDAAVLRHQSNDSNGEFGYFYFGLPDVPACHEQIVSLRESGQGIHALVSSVMFTLAEDRWSSVGAYGPPVRGSSAFQTASIPYDQKYLGGSGLASATAGDVPLGTSELFGGDWTSKVEIALSHGPGCG